MRRERELEDLIECWPLNEADPGQPVTRVSAVLDRHTGRVTALVAVNAGQAGLPGGLLFSAKPPGAAASGVRLLYERLGFTPAGVAAPRPRRRRATDVIGWHSRRQGQVRGLVTVVSPGRSLRQAS
jgi:hypothetical protein